MRDPNRIDPFLEEVRKLWKKYPDWRFGQLVANAHRVFSTNPDPFFIEDDMMLEAIKNLNDVYPPGAQNDSR